MRLGLTERDAHAEDGAFAIKADAHDDERRAVHQHAAMAHLLPAPAGAALRAKA